MLNKEVGKFSFKVPDGHPEQGTKIEKTFEYDVCANEDEAVAELESRPKLTLVSLVNDYLKTAARSNAYQAAVIPYRASDVSPETIQERMVKDMIRLGMTEEAARSQVNGLFPG